MAFGSLGTVAGRSGPAPAPEPARTLSEEQLKRKRARAIVQAKAVAEERRLVREQAKAFAAQEAQARAAAHEERRAKKQKERPAQGRLRRRRTTLGHFERDEERAAALTLLDALLPANVLIERALHATGPPSSVRRLGDLCPPRLPHSGCSRRRVPMAPRAGARSARGARAASARPPPRRTMWRARCSGASCAPCAERAPTPTIAPRAWRAWPLRGAGARRRTLCSGGGARRRSLLSQAPPSRAPRSSRADGAARVARGGDAS